MKILVAMSGGVDSSAAALLLKRQCHDCVGCTMRLYDNADAGLSGRTCCSLDDVEDARSVARSLGMNYYVFNFADDFREKVMKKFADSYRRGLTPNPCIDCNRYMKFGKLYERAQALGCSHIATGHYARICRENGKYLLKKALDGSKDQSYVLYCMTQAELGRTLFPLGEMSKADIRALAAQAGLVNAEKPDSQNICFVPDGDHAAAIERITGVSPRPGDFVDASGRILGHHGGIERYTVGQHRRLGVALGERRYVCRVRPENNTVVLGTERELYGKTLMASDFSWISGETPDKPIFCRARLRYRQPEQPVLVTPLPGGRVRLSFDEPQRAITPGQAAVLYDGDTVLGGGTIELDGE